MKHILEHETTEFYELRDGARVMVQRQPGNVHVGYGIQRQSPIYDATFSGAAFKLAARMRATASTLQAHAAELEMIAGEEAAKEEQEAPAP